MEDKKKKDKKTNITLICFFVHYLFVFRIPIEKLGGHDGLEVFDDFSAPFGHLQFDDPRDG